MNASSKPKKQNSQPPQQPQQQLPTLCEQDVFINKSLNQIQQAVVSLLEPINLKYSYYLTKGFLDIWKNSSNFKQIDLEINLGCEKIIQIIVAMQIEPHEVVNCANKWIEANKFDVQKDRRVVELDSEHKEQATL
jgi:hypothetical protein